MKILIITQAIDKNDPILGFFHRWVEEFKKQCDQIHVICLRKGEYSFPAGVSVHSLGKEKKQEFSIVYAWRLIVISWKFRAEYDTVFVHMNPEYVIVAGWLWRLLGKEIRFWYAHGAVNTRLRVASYLANAIYTSTQDGYRISSKKVHIVGQGIDTKHFASLPANIVDSNTLRFITVGRITQSKRIETLLRAMVSLHNESISCVLTVVGSVQTPAETKYFEELQAYVAQHKLSESVIFVGAVTQASLPETLRKHTFFLSDGATGSLDKAMLEASACGLIVISSNQAFKRIMQPILPETVYPPQDHTALAECIRNAIQQDIVYMRNIQKNLLVTPNTIESLIVKIMKPIDVI